ASTAKLIEKALTAEQAALDVSKKIRKSDGATVATEVSQFYMANSRGFAGGYPSSDHHISVSPIAQEKKSKNSPMYRDFWYSSELDPKKLAKPASIGKTAAERALARMGARKISTRQCPVLFEPRMAAGLIRHFLGAISGGAQFRESSFLLNSLGQQAWASHLTIKEDPFIPGGRGSSPFDGEGVKVKARTLLKSGVVNGYLLNTYSARKLDMKSTGNDGGAHNLLVSSKQTVPGGFKAMLKKMGTGLLVTEAMGQGVNSVTGDYSRGAFGYWVENGAIVHPVEEITIAGNLKDIYMGLVAIGDDFEWVGNKWVSSMLIEQMTVAGN
ncbi:MAG: metallopeptidase TldD-related protein, partial [Limnobacter sp.]|nr:metallopeptidase TldD-related protein [Limnobacter sp.]